MAEMPFSMPKPICVIEWRGSGDPRWIRIFVDPPPDEKERRGLIDELQRMVDTFRGGDWTAHAQDLAKAKGWDLFPVVIDTPDHADPFGMWVTIAFRTGAGRAH